MAEISPERLESIRKDLADPWMVSFKISVVRGLVADLDEARRECDEARTALRKILAIRRNPEPPSLKLLDIYHIAGEALPAPEPEVTP